MAATVPFCLGAVFVIQRFYLKTSRQLRLLDLEAKSPLYTNYIETLAGLVTVRAFQWQQDFNDRNSLFLDNSQQPLYLLYCVQRWLNLVLDMLVAALVVILVTLAVELRNLPGSISAGGIGVALVTAMNFNQSVSVLIRFWTSMETSLGAIARIKAFESQTASEERPFSPEPPPSVGWPSLGAIEFRNVSASYK